MDATSLNARQAPAPTGSERRFLDDQAAHARTAMKQTLHEMKETAMQVVDVRSCARQHPWLVAGSAVAAGFVVGAVLSHSPRKQVRRTQLHSESNGVPTEHEQVPSRSETPTWLSTVGKALTAAVVTVLQGALTAAAVSLFSGDVTADETLPSDGAAPQGELENGTE